MRRVIELVQDEIVRRSGTDGKLDASSISADTSGQKGRRPAEKYT
jgi:hypothetical protein